MYKLRPRGGHALCMILQQKGSAAVSLFLSPLRVYAVKKSLNAAVATSVCVYMNVEGKGKLIYSTELNCCRAGRVRAVI